MKDKIIHFSYWKNATIAACGADSYGGLQFSGLKVTDIRKKVTCKRCKNTARFRKIK